MSDGIPINECLTDQSSRESEFGCVSNDKIHTFKFSHVVSVVDEELTREMDFSGDVRLGQVAVPLCDHYSEFWIKHHPQAGM